MPKNQCSGQFCFSKLFAKAPERDQLPLPMGRWFANRFLRRGAGPGGKLQKNKTWWFSFSILVLEVLCSAPLFPKFILSGTLPTIKRVEVAIILLGLRRRRGRGELGPNQTFACLVGFLHLPLPPFWMLFVSRGGKEAPACLLSLPSSEISLVEKHLWGGWVTQRASWKPCCCQSLVGKGISSPKEDLLPCQREQTCRSLSVCVLNSSICLE